MGSPSHNCQRQSDMLRHLWWVLELQWARGTDKGYSTAKYLCHMLYRCASMQTTCTASVVISTNRLRDFMFFKVQKSVGLRRTGVNLKITVLWKLVTVAKDGWFVTEVGGKTTVLCWPSGDVAPPSVCTVCLVFWDLDLFGVGAIWDL